ncbi:MAG: HAMP domain-containing histidine kinase [Acidobacteriia bacterium]|nr:HAMP domain-containing histidine kinase [Terriglobia bacterium]
MVVLVLLPSTMLVTLGIRLMDQDRALEERQRRELADGAIDRTAVLLQKELAAIQQRFVSAAWVPPSGTVLLRNGQGHLLYQPSPTALPEAPTEPFVEADRAEFQSGDAARALALCTRLASSTSAPVRAGALLRIGRIHRKALRLDAALAAWNSLAEISAAAIAGEPAGLVARRARCRLFADANRPTELRQEAAQLLTDLYDARWPLDHNTFLLVVQQASQWAGVAPDVPSEMSRQAAAALALWPQRRTVEGALCDGPYTLIWQLDDALLAGPRYRAEHWEAPHSVHLTCAGEPVPQGVSHQAAAAGLPWSVTIAPDTAPLREFSARRAALLSALPALLVLICAVAYFAWRAIRRELGIARLQSDFVAAVSHEFRTPLTSLRQFNEMMLDEPSLAPEARLSYLKAQGRATDRLSRLVETLLDFGRMEAGRRSYQLEPLDAGALVRDISAEFSAEPLAQGFTVDCRTPCHALPVDADREALGRAVWNLLHNAVKYSGASRDILVAAERAPSGVTIRVVDHGLGIPLDEQPRLFQRFVRGESIRKLGIPGTGIGLAMVRHITEAHGGSVDLESKEGEGSTFRLMLPGRG